MDLNEINKEFAEGYEYIFVLFFLFFFKFPNVLYYFFQRVR